MKSQVLLLNWVLVDSGIRCCTSITRDSKTIASRVKGEGISFLTITLPNFGKDLEIGLDQGYVDSTLFVGYSKSGCLPVFLRGFTSLVFDASSGALLDEPSIDAIHCLRQICYLSQKLELPCSPEREKAAYTAYIKCEQSVRDSRLSSGDHLIDDFQRVSRLLFGDMLTKIDRQIYNGECVPKHGPGATADKLRGNAKYGQRLWTDRLEEIFPAMDFLYSSARHYLDSIEDGDGPVWLDPGSEIPVKVISVPKTLKTPRIIAIEPTHMQYVQQGLMEMIVNAIEETNSLPGRFIGFEDQQTNRDLACQGSKFGDLATLDLSEASDRVSTQHVELLLADTPWLRQAVFACRSSKAEVPGYGVQTLSKYASMGSALTFPLEAMVFLTIVFIGIETELNAHISKELLSEFFGKVRIYGDDIIVPVEYVRSVVGILSSFGMKVNLSKSFWTGRFRESCGGDYYAGYDITVVRSRRILPQQPKHVQEIISAVSFRNQCYSSGFWKTAEFMDDWLRKFIPMPNVHATSPGLGRFSYLGFDTQRECPYLQRPLVRAAVDTSQAPKSNLSGRDALLKCLLKRGSEPFADSKHLERAGRPDAVNIKLRWVPPY